MSGKAENPNHDHHHEGAEMKSLTNIYYNCLERILEFLDIKDLLSVAQTCKRRSC